MDFQTLLMELVMFFCAVNEACVNNMKQNT